MSDLNDEVRRGIEAAQGAWTGYTLNGGTGSYTQIGAATVGGVADFTVTEAGPVVVDLPRAARGVDRILGTGVHLSGNVLTPFALRQVTATTAQAHSKAGPIEAAVGDKIHAQYTYQAEATS